FHAAPQNARLTLVREKSDSAKLYFHRLRQMNGTQCGVNRVQLSGIRFTDEFQSDVHSFRARPAHTARQKPEPSYYITKRGAHSLGNIERDEQAHRSPAANSGVEKIAAHHVERRLRGVETDALAVTRETDGVFARTALVGDCDMDQSHRFFRSAA